VIGVRIYLPWYVEEVKVCSMTVMPAEKKVTGVLKMLKKL
jgi:hypothetical protein